MYHCCCESSVYYFVHAVPGRVARLQTAIYMNYHMAVVEKGTYYYTVPVDVSHYY